MEQLQNFSPNFNPDQPTYEFKLKKKRRKLKIFSIILLVIILLPVVGYFALDLIGKVITKPFDDSDLQLSAVNIRPEDNGFFLMQEAEKHMVDLKEFNIYQFLETIPEKDEWDKSGVNEFLTKNKKAIEIFNQIADKKYFQLPAFTDPANLYFNAPSVSSTGWRALARISILESLHLAHHSDTEKSITQAIKILRIGHNIGQGQGTLINSLIGMAIQKNSLNLIRKINSENLIDPKLSKNTIRILEELKNNRLSAINALKIEYIMNANTWDALAEGTYYQHYGEEFGHWNWYSFNPKETKRLMANIAFRPLIEIIQKEDCSGLSTNILKLKQKEKNFNNRKFINFLKPNIAGKKLAFITASSFDGFLERACSMDNNVDLTRLLLALKQFENQNQKPPDSLDELVPEFIDKIPKDTFSGKDLRYLPEKGIIYSVGADNVDNGGNPKSDIIIDIQNPTFDFY
jgi:hypothetical protein